MHNVTKIPLLGDIPLLGALFRSTHGHGREGQPRADPHAAHHPERGRHARDLREAHAGAAGVPRPLLRLPRRAAPRLRPEARPRPPRGAARVERGGAPSAGASRRPAPQTVVASHPAAARHSTCPPRQPGVASAQPSAPAQPANLHVAAPGGTDPRARRARERSCRNSPARRCRLRARCSPARPSSLGVGLAALTCACSSTTTTSTPGPILPLRTLRLYETGRRLLRALRRARVVGPARRCRSRRATSTTRSRRSSSSAPEARAPCRASSSAAASAAGWRARSPGCPWRATSPSSLQQLLVGLKGAGVDVRARGGPYTGRIVDVVEASEDGVAAQGRRRRPRRRRGRDPKPTRRPRPLTLLVLTDAGAIVRIPRRRARLGAPARSELRRRASARRSTRSRPAARRASGSFTSWHGEDPSRSATSPRRRSGGRRTASCSTRRQGGGAPGLGAAPQRHRRGLARRPRRARERSPRLVPLPARRPRGTRGASSSRRTTSSRPCRSSWGPRSTPSGATRLATPTAPVGSA